MERLTPDQRWNPTLARVRENFDAAAFQQVTAFLASVGQRLYPNYRAFCVDSGSGDPEFVGWVMSTVWTQLLHRTLDYGTLVNLSRRLESVVPSKDAFASVYLELARYALSSIDLALRSLSRSNVEDVSQAAVLSLESTYRYLKIVTTRLVPEVPTVESQLEEQRWIVTSPMMRYEIKRLERDAEICCERDVTRDLLEKLRNDEELEGIMPFRRGLIKPPPPAPELRAVDSRWPWRRGRS